MCWWTCISWTLKMQNEVMYMMYILCHLCQKTESAIRDTCAGFVSDGSSSATESLWIHLITQWHAAPTQLSSGFPFFNTVVGAIHCFSYLKGKEREREKPLPSVSSLFKCMWTARTRLKLGAWNSIWIFHMSGSKTAIWATTSYLPGSSQAGSRTGSETAQIQIRHCETACWHPKWRLRLVSQMPALHSASM